MTVKRSPAKPTRCPHCRTERRYSGDELYCCKCGATWGRSPCDARGCGKTHGRAAKKPTKAEMIAASLADTKRRVRRSNTQAQQAELEKAVVRAAMEWAKTLGTGALSQHTDNVDALLSACAAARKGGVR